MSIMQKSEKLKKAIEWISVQIKYEKKTDLNELVQQASVKFNLSPKDEGFLQRFYSEKNK